MALVAALTACGGGGGAEPVADESEPQMAADEPAAMDESEPMDESAATDESAETMTDTVPAALAVTGTTVGGEPLDLATHLDGGPAVLWFWAPWCAVCAAEADDVAAQAEASAGEVTFVGVAAHDDAAAMRDFVERHGLEGFEHLADEEGVLWEHFGVSAQPAYVFVSADGELTLVPSSLRADELAAEVDRLRGG